MKNVFVALALALVLGPAAALADDTNNAPPPRPQLTQQQRQALHQTFETFRTQEEQLNKQLRASIVNSISPARRAAVAGIFGQLAISPDPNPAAAAKQLDGLLSQSEQQRILSLHSQFRTQARNLHEQMRKQIESELPDLPKPPGGDRMGGQEHAHAMTQRNPDAGTVLLHILGHTGMGGMEMGMEHHGWMGPGGPPHR